MVLSQPARTSTGGVEAPWRGDGHSGQQLPYERRDRRVVAVTSSLCSDSPGSVRACRQAFAGDPARTPTATSAFPFASSREAHGLQAPSPQRQSAVSRSQRADLGLESPSYVHSCPFVSIRGSTSPLRFPSRLRVGPTARPPLLAAAVRRQLVAEGRSRAGKPELRAFVSIRVHSWFNVTPAFPFASSRDLHVAQTPFPQWQSAVSGWQRADLGLESPSYIHSCPFVSIRGSTSPLRFLRVFA